MPLVSLERLQAQSWLAMAPKLMTGRGTELHIDAAHSHGLVTLAIDLAISVLQEPVQPLLTLRAGR